MSFLAFLLWFYLFVTSSALTYLSLRAWLGRAQNPPPPSEPAPRAWQEGAGGHVLRTVGFAGVTLAALIAAVNDPRDHGGSFDIASLARIVGYVVLLLGTPPRLRRQSVVTLAFALQLMGVALLLFHASGQLLPGFVNPADVSPIVLIAVGLMDAGIGLLWRRWTRTILRVRLPDRFTLALVGFSLFLMLLVTLLGLAVIRSNLVGALPDADIGEIGQSLLRPILALFVAAVVLSAIVAFFLARYLLAPIERMGAALRAIGRGALETRLRGIRSRDEMQDLAHEINQMARRLHEADGLRAEFVSFASHELRNPLTAIKGFIETLQMADASPSERAEIYAIVRGECERLLRMTDELLQTSRVEAGRPIALRRQTFDLRRLAEKVTAIMRTHTDTHELVVIAPAAPVQIEADPDKCEQVLINLLSNAIKYAPDGGRIETWVTDGGKTVELAVRDRGLGMSREQAERVFDKFYRIGDGPRLPAEAAGTGLGLYLTRALVNAHGGSIRVESAPGEGSTFTVTLPRRAPAEEPCGEERATTAPVPAARTRG